MPYHLATAQYSVVLFHKQEFHIQADMKKRQNAFSFYMGWIVGFEPTASRATIWRSSQLNYIHHRKAIKGLARLKGLEPLAYCLEGNCSIQLSYWRVCQY